MSANKLFRASSSKEFMIGATCAFPVVGINPDPDPDWLMADTFATDRFGGDAETSTTFFLPSDETALGVFFVVVGLLPLVVVVALTSVVAGAGVDPHLPNSHPPTFLPIVAFSGWR